ncbi:MAG: glycoside hydrolase family 32 protein [Candidatus Latescibacterota bacterium]
MTQRAPKIDPRRQRFVADPHRPLYHYLPPANWMNDPNGAIFWKGRYHLFYQANPDNPFWGNIQWGHAVSGDLVHWEDLPMALVPDPDGPDRDGCFSGGAFVKDGVPTLIYHAYHKEGRGGNCIATSHDDLLTWQKDPDNPVIPSVGEEVEYRAYDPCGWREGDTFYALSGGTSKRGGDTAFLFRSKDLHDWEYLHEFYEPGWENDCAVPDFFPLGDRHMLLFASHKRGTQYYIGTYEDHTFRPETHGRMAYGGFVQANLCASITLSDDTGRRILFGWINEGRDEEAQKTAGWAGVMSLPRRLSLGSDLTLRIDPVTELEILRGEHRAFSDREVAADSRRMLDEAAGECIEIAAVFEPAASDDPGRGAQAYGLCVRTSPDAEEETVLRYDREQHTLTLDVSRASIGDDAVCKIPETGPLVLGEDEALQLRVFVDRSVVEVFANGRQCLTKRIYPSRSDSLGVGLVAQGGRARLRTLDVWQMKAIWPT